MTLIPYQPYIDTAFYIRNVSGQDISCFISKYTGGDDNWFRLSSSFSDGRWGHSGWEVVVFKNADDSQRRGLYLNNRGKTVYITFRSFENIEITSSV